MKMKILTSIIVVAISATVIISTTSRSDNTRQSEEEVFPQQIERIASKNFSQKLDNKPTIQEWDHQPINPNISMEELAGPINKEYNIREDILRYIEKEIPANNVIAKEAAIKYAQAEQFIYYKASQKEAIKTVSRQIIALKCLRYSIHTNEPKMVTRNIDKLMRNTPERDKHMWHIDETYFGWKVLGHEPITKAKLKEICETGNY